MQPSSDYREPFSIVEDGFEIDEYGDQHAVESTVYSGFARVSNLSSKEFWEAAALGNESTVKLFARYHPILDGIDQKKNYVRWRGKRLDIVSVDNVNSRNEQAIIRAKEVR